MSRGGRFYGWGRADLFGLTLRQLAIWERHARVVGAEEQLEAAAVQSIPWLSDEVRHEVVADLLRQAGREVTAKAAGDVEMIDEETFRREIGAPPRPKEK